MPAGLNTLKDLLEKESYQRLPYEGEEEEIDAANRAFRKKAQAQMFGPLIVDDEWLLPEQIAAQQTTPISKGLNQKNILFIGVGTFSLLSSAMFKKEPFSTLGMIVGAGVIGLGISDAIGLFKIPSF